MLLLLVAISVNMISTNMINSTIANTMIISIMIIIIHDTTRGVCRTSGGETKGVPRNGGRKQQPV